MWSRLLRDESGLVITAELVLIITVAVIALAAGWGAVASMMAEELEDVGNMMGVLDQTWNVSGYRAVRSNGNGAHGFSNGMGFNDEQNTVSVVSDTNFNAQVAGIDFSGLIPEIQTPVIPEVQVAAAADSAVLVENEFGIAVAIEEVQLLELVELGIVEVREDGSVLLLREELVEIRSDGSVVIRREAVERERRLLEQQSESALKPTLDATQSSSRVSPTGNRDVRLKLEELRKENAELRSLLERLCRQVEAGR
jgi:ABC-type Na+ efflux pump permease subunit